MVIQENKQTSKQANKPISGALQTNAEVIFYISSSGHCSLDCSYCIINPIAKHKSSLTLLDIEYLLERVGGKCALAFSGVGDFFAGYKKNDRFLSGLLEYDVEVGLDINGVMIHEFPLLSEEQLDKIVHINLTMHYSQLVEKKACAAWANNARIILQKERCQTFLMGMIVSPGDVEMWHSALIFYEREIFETTGQKIVLITDMLNWDVAFNDKLNQLRADFSHLVADTLAADFSQVFPDDIEVLCPAGKSFFRVWNDGRIEGCTRVGELADFGNVKARQFEPRGEAFLCTRPRYCECQVIGKLGRMCDARSGGVLQPKLMNR